MQVLKSSAFLCLGPFSCVLATMRSGITIPFYSAISNQWSLLFYSDLVNFRFSASGAAMGTTSDDVATKASFAIQYRSFTDVELLWKRRLEGEGDAAARKALQDKRVVENDTCKRAHNGETLRSWLTRARNARRLSMGAAHFGDNMETAVPSNTPTSMFVGTSTGGGSDLQLLSSTPGVVQLSSDDSPTSLGRANDYGWSCDELPDLDDDFNAVDEGEACDLGLAK